MPRYEFRCDECDRDVDIVMSVASYAELGPVLCHEDHELRRVYSMPAVKLAGPGFYRTDYRNRDRQKAEGRARLQSGEAFADLTDD